MRWLGISKFVFLPSGLNKLGQLRHRIKDLLIQCCAVSSCFDMKTENKVMLFISLNGLFWKQFQKLTKLSA